MARKKKEAPNRKDNLYEVKVTVGKKFDGTPIRKSFYSRISKEDAKEKANQYKIEKEVANRTGIGFVNQNVTFAEWAYQWLETYKKPDIDENTYLYTYKCTIYKHLIPYFGSAQLNSIKPVDIKNFYLTKNHMSKSRLSKMHICLNGIFETAIDNDLCYKNPAKKIKFTSLQQKKERKIYTDEEIAIVKAFFYNKLPEVVLLLETGLRRGELLGLKWEDIDMEQKILSVNRSIAEKYGGGVTINPPKWNSYRTIPLSDTAIQLLKNLKTERQGYLFPTHNNTPQSPNTWSQKLNRNMKGLPPSIPILTAHEIRHTYGTYLRRHGVDIYTIQKLLGHKNISVTSEIYVHNEIGTLKTVLKNI